MDDQFGTHKVLAAYSHSMQSAGLRLCHTVAVTSPVCPEAEREASIEPASTILSHFCPARLRSLPLLPRQNSDEGGSMS